ncbi:MAG TPA: hypothetical protein VMT20_19820 [Terriglobia bacterium]|nr:hypothetical protein [Terriglobia bacterium]
MSTTKKDERKGLTHAPKRFIITLGSVMIRIKHEGVEIECDTVEEAEGVLKHIREEGAKMLKYEVPGLIADDQDIGSIITGWTQVSRWKAETFQEFIESIGESQETALRMLVREKRVSDAELREELGVESNQQLAGILSGISKQAAALGIPARAVFTIENEFKSGKSSKSYVVARDFLEITKEMNWPID